MSLLELPPSAAWRHQGARDGFEVAFLRSEQGRHVFEGTTSAVEDGEPWVVSYRITVGADWSTRGARVWTWSSVGYPDLSLEADGEGTWVSEGTRLPQLDGCLDVDLESSALTNALPVLRLNLAPGEQAAAPAAYVRARDLAVERLEQRYARLHDRGRERYEYMAPRFGFECELSYDKAGLVQDYPGIAVRAG